MSESETGRDTILAVGAACGEPVRKALLELLEIFEGQVKRAYAHELAEKQRDRYSGTCGCGCDCSEFIDPEVSDGE